MKKTIALSLLLSACTSRSPEDPWAEHLANTGKADTFEAPFLEYGTNELRQSAANSFLLFRLAVRDGDEFSIDLTQLNGELPDVRVFSANHSAGGAFEDLDPEHVDFASGLFSNADFHGRQFEARADETLLVGLHAEDSSSYHLVVSCVGGPCFETPIAPNALPPAVVDSCLARARECAFEDMLVFHGAVGEIRAQQIWDECLEKVTTDSGASCINACQDFSGGASFSQPSRVCHSVVDSLPFYADTDSDCHETLDECLETCGAHADDHDNGNTDDLEWRPFAQCWSLGIQSSCESFVKHLPVCGGEFPASGFDECIAELGPWIDHDDVCD